MTRARHQGPFAQMRRRGPGQPSPAAQTLAQAVAAYDAMAAARPLVAPPLPRVGDTRTAAAKALAREIARGEYRP